MVHISFKVRFQAISGSATDRPVLAGARPSELTVAARDGPTWRPSVTGFQGSESKEPDARAKIGEGQPSLNAAGGE